MSSKIVPEHSAQLPPTNQSPCRSDKRSPCRMNGTPWVGLWFACLTVVVRARKRHVFPSTPGYESHLGIGRERRRRPDPAGCLFGRFCLKIKKLQLTPQVRASNCMVKSHPRRSSQSPSNAYYPSNGRENGPVV